MSDYKIGFIMREAAKNGVNLDYQSVKETLKQSSRYRENIDFVGGGSDYPDSIFIDGRKVAKTVSDSIDRKSRERGR